MSLCLNLLLGLLRRALRSRDDLPKENLVLRSWRCTGVGRQWGTQRMARRRCGAMLRAHAFLRYACSESSERRLW